MVSLWALLFIAGLQILAQALRLGHGPGSQDLDGFSLVRNVDDIGKSNLSSAVAAWMAEVSTAQVGTAFKPSLNLLGQGWQLLVPLTLFGPSDFTFKGCPTVPQNDKKVHMKLMPNGQLCMAGQGFETRAASTMAMIQEAASILRKRGTFPAPFGEKVICIGDTCTCEVDFGYSTKDYSKGCRMRRFPDFTFWKWPEARLLPNFTVVTQTLEEIGRSSAEKEVCGWAGNPDTHFRILPRYQLATNHIRGKFEIFSSSRWSWMSIEDQTRRWACLVDLPPVGYSGRVPMLLHSGRPLLLVERGQEHYPSVGSGHFTDSTWYSDWLEPWVHYIPVHRDLHDLEEAMKMAMSEEGREIAKRASRLANEMLTTDAAVKGIADILLSISGPTTPSGPQLQ